MTGCKKPCKECPYQKGSMRGYFGENDPTYYSHAINREEIVPCHMRSKHTEEGEVAKAFPCSGLVFSMRKSCKLPKEKKLRGLLEGTRQLSGEAELVKNALASWEFEEYHRL